MIVNFNNFRDKNITEKIKQIFAIALCQVNKKQNISVNITVVGKQKIQQMNNEFRGVDKVTDVLSFPLLETEELTSNVMQNEDELTDLGDIVICKSKVISQAKEYGHSYEREFCFLALHGFLHVLGFDHIKKDEESIMFNLQDKILKKAKMER